jgi:Ger(x)C family germination protein
LDKKRTKLLSLLASVSILVTGCWDATEVNKFDLVTMVILDKPGDQFTFTFEIPRIMPVSAEGSSAGNKNSYIMGSGANIPEARNNAEQKLEKPLFLGTLRTLVITEKAAASDLTEYLFRLREDSTYRQKVILITTRDDPDTFILFEGETDSPGGAAISDMLTALEQGGKTYMESTSHYVEDILSGRSFVVHNIDVVNKQHALTGYSVFQNAMLIGFIPVEQAKGLVFLLANKPIFVYRIPFSQNFATVEVRLAGRKITPVYKDGIVRFKLQMKYDAMILYFTQAQLFPLDKKALDEINQNLNQMLQEEIQNTIAQSQTQFQSDYLEFCDAFRTAYPDVYEKINWMQEYPKAQIEVQTQVDLSVSQIMDYEPR